MWSSAESTTAMTAARVAVDEPDDLAETDAHAPSVRTRNSGMIRVRIGRGVKVRRRAATSIIVIDGRYARTRGLSTARWRGRRDEPMGTLFVGVRHR